MKVRSAILASVAAVLLATGATQATTLPPDTFFTGTSGALAASVNFHDNGGGLMTVTLTNTSTADVMNPAQVLTAVFFDVNASVTFSRISATVADGSTVYFGATDAGGVVGGEWALKNGLSGAPGNAALGVSSSGLGLFGPGDLFPGSDLQSPESPDGLQYGITSAGDIMTTGNAQVTGSQALIKNSVVFQLTYDPVETFVIENVSFQYGTDMEEPNIPGVPVPGDIGGGAPGSVPEPLTVLGVLASVGGVGAYLRKRKEA